MKKILFLLCFLLFLTPQVGATTATVLGTAGSGASFSPDSIAGLVLWLKADAIAGLNDGDAVTTWTDSSTAGNNATQATANNKPSYQTNEINGLPVVRFDGTNDGMALAALPSSTFSIFAVIKPTWKDDGWIFIADSNDQIRYAQSGGNVLSCYDGTNNPQSNAMDAGDGATFIAEFICDGTNVAFYESGTARGSGVLNTTMTLDRLGDSNGGGISGDLAEIIVYSSALSDPNRIKVEDFLSAKYGIAVTH